MPEAPEVETVRKVLAKDLIGLSIVGVEIYYDKLIINDNAEFMKNIIGKKINGISRYGKYLIFHFDDYVLISHLRMEGKYFYVDSSYPLNKHIHLAFKLINDKILMYQDVRKFGRFHLVKTNDFMSTNEIKKLGLDLLINPNYKLDEIYEKFKKRKKEIKLVLLDQSIICGLGNIYADEVLYDAKIRPDRLSSSLSKEDIKGILDSSIEILNKAVQNKGTTIRSYTSSLGVTGNYQNYLNAHSKAICKCGANIKKIKLGGRGTYFCEACQK